MLSCLEKYTIDPLKVQAFEHFVMLWIPLVERYGGRHHGFFLPNELGGTTSFSLVTFASREAYDSFLLKSDNDRECQAAIWYLNDSQCVVEVNRSFFSPIF